MSSVADNINKINTDFIPLVFEMDTQIKPIMGLNFNYAAIIKFSGKICVHLRSSAVQ